MGTNVGPNTDCLVVGGSWFYSVPPDTCRCSSSNQVTTVFWARSQNCERRLLASSCLSVRMEQSALTGRISMNFDIWFSEYNQQDATFPNLFISVRRSTWFRRVFRPSTGAQNCTYGLRPLLLPAASLTRLAAGSSNGLTNAWRCMCSFELLVVDGKTVWNM